MSLALETREAPVRIVELDGRQTEGALFLHTLGDQESRLETISRRLNDVEATFLPVRVNGGIDLVHLAWVAYVAADGRSGDVGRLEEVGARRAPVTLELAHGETVTGELLYAAPADQSRVSDLLNSGGERFLLLLAPDSTLYVHRAAIRRARAL